MVTSVCMCMYKCMYICIYAHTHTHIYIYACLCAVFKCKALVQEHRCAPTLKMTRYSTHTSFLADQTSTKTKICRARSWEMPRAMHKSLQNTALSIPQDWISTSMPHPNVCALWVSRFLAAHSHAAMLKMLRTLRTKKTNN